MPSSVTEQPVPAAVPTGTSDGLGVPQGTPQGQGDAKPLSPAELQVQLQKLEEDRRAQQSVYDRKLAEAQRRADELQAKLREFQTSGMDDAQKIAFERDQYKSQLEQFQAQQRVSQYADAFVSAFGIDKSQLDLTDEQTVAASGWQAVMALTNDLKAKVQAPVQTAAPQPPQNATKILTGSGGVPRTKPTQAEFMNALAQNMGKPSLTLEEFYTYVERHPEVMNQWLSQE